MPWCPKCKNEYVEGITVCADCGCELVDSLENCENILPLFESTKEEIEKLQIFLESNDIKPITVECLEDTGDYRLSCGENSFQKATRFTKVFLAELAREQMQMMSEEEAQSALEDMARLEEENVFAAEMEDNMEPPTPEQAEEVMRGTYKNYKERAEDNKSSAYTLLLVGGIGLVADILVFTDVLHLPLGGSSKYMILGVMGALFLLFLVMGVVSFSNAKRYAEKASGEDHLTQEIIKFCKENITLTIIDQGLFTDEEADFTEEQKYFKRSEKMKQMITENFLNLDKGYLERFVDEHYENVMKETW